MKTRELITIIIAVILCSAMGVTVASQQHIMNEMKKDQQEYVNYIDATEGLLDEMEDSCVIEPFLEGDKGAAYLEASKKLYGEVARYNAKLKYVQKDIDE